jgi:hypothetical protein
MTTTSYAGQWKQAKDKPNNQYYTPESAMTYVYDHLKYFKTVWEPCCGANHITRYLTNKGYVVFSSDITMGPEYDFFTYQPRDPYDVIVTNPPFQGKRLILERLYSLNKPFAVLMPTMTLDSNPIRKMLKQDPTWGVLMPPKTINYIPADHKHYADTDTRHPKGTRSFFHSSWFCHDIPGVRGVVIL